MEPNMPAVVAILKTRIAAQDVALSDLRKEIVQLGKDAARTDRLHRAALDAAEVSIADHAAELVRMDTKLRELRAETVWSHVKRALHAWYWSET